MKKSKTLPIYGVGPIYVISCLILTIIALILNCYKIIPVLKFLDLFMIILGILCITIGVILWLSAVLVTKIDRKIKEGKLITTGIYSIVRNPIYSAFLFIFTGIIFLVNNIYLLVLPITFWIYLTILLKLTEEKWLEDKFTDEYNRYSKNVNRVIPNIFKYKK
ncbi:MAG: isoprenylcysteine carboxylmethyltransferase family protein [Clostridiales bacterium]|nr:isoprenylcysteine carboxylmethyltransferase family protein [Clostridiales bacterium]